MGLMINDISPSDPFLKLYLNLIAEFNSLYEGWKGNKSVLVEYIVETYLFRGLIQERNRIGSYNG